MCNAGAANQRIERLESSKQSTEDKVHRLQGDSVM